MKVVWTEHAFARLADIQGWIAGDDPAAAVRLAERLIRRSEALSTSPRLVRRVAELAGTALRELVERNYRIVYRIGAKRIEVLTVFEGHRLFPFEDVSEE